jgi:hypothetical protein
MLRQVNEYTIYLESEMTALNIGRK